MYKRHDLYHEVSLVMQSSSNIVLDVRAVELIDSSGLGFILNCFKDLVANGGSLKVVADKAMVLSLFELVYFYKIVEVYRSVDEAVSSFESEMKSAQ